MEVELFRLPTMPRRILLPVLFAPALERHLAYANLANRISNRPVQDITLAQLRDNLLKFIFIIQHIGSPPNLMKLGLSTSWGPIMRKRVEVWTIFFSGHSASSALLT